MIVRAGGGVRVEAWESERVQASTESRWGMKIERRRAAIEVQIGGGGAVLVPPRSAVTVYAGKSAEVRGVGGPVTIYAGGAAVVRDAGALAHVSAGRSIDMECQAIAGQSVSFTAGGDARLFVRDLADALLTIDDLGGYWEALIGDGSATVRVKAGGDVTLVTDRAVSGQPPHYILGKIERPDAT